MTHVAYRGDSPEIQTLLDGVTSSLPQKVSQFVIRRVCFIAVGAAHGHGQTWPRRFIKPAHGYGDKPAEWVIVLSEDGVTERVVAHEIAHAWCDHGDGPRWKEEEEANRLATEWGFPPD